jgi:hypothetical protein
LKKLLQGCEAKTKDLCKIFEKIEARPEKKSVLDMYKKVVLKLKSGRVETLMGDILKDLEVLGTYAVFKDAVAPKVVELEKAKEELAKVEPSLPDSMFEGVAGTAINYGRDQMNSFGGTLTKVDGNNYQAGRDQHFGTEPKRPKNTKKEQISIRRRTRLSIRTGSKFDVVLADFYMEYQC